MSRRPDSARRGFVLRMLLGCAGAIGMRYALAGPIYRSDPAYALALRVAWAAGTLPDIASLASMGCVEQTVPALLTAIFESPASSQMLQLSIPQLQRQLAARIQQDYQRGTVVLQHGWWLARSEVAILKLRWLLAQQAVSH